MLPVDHRSTAARRYRTCRPISRQGGPAPSRCQRRSVDNDTWSTPATSCSVNRPSSSPIIPVVTAPPVPPRLVHCLGVEPAAETASSSPSIALAAIGRRPREEHRLRVVTDATRDVPVGRQRRSGSPRRRRRTTGPGTPPWPDRYCSWSVASSRVWYSSPHRQLGDVGHHPPLRQPLGLGAAPGGLLDGWGVPLAWFSSGRSAGPDPGRIVRQVGGGRRR